MRELTFDLRDLRFTAIEWGEPVGVPTVLLHGYLDHAGSWSRVAEQLPGWRIALDLRGHGGSAWAGPGQSYHFAEYVADLDALVTQLGRVKLIGHSMGGTIATLYAGARPERVERVASVDGLGLADGGAGARERMVQFLDGIGRVRPHRVFASVEEAAARLRAAWPFVDADWARELAARGTRAVEGGRVWAYDPRHRVRAATPYRQDQHLCFLAAIRCPILSVHPSDSPFAASDVARLEAAVADLHVAELPNVGHMAQLQAPDALAALLAPFIASP